MCLCVRRHSGGGVWRVYGEWVLYNRPDEEWLLPAGCSHDVGSSTVTHTNFPNATLSCSLAAECTNGQTSTHNPAHHRTACTCVTTPRRLLCVERRRWGPVQGGTQAAAAAAAAACSPTATVRRPRPAGDSLKDSKGAETRVRNGCCEADDRKIVDPRTPTKKWKLATASVRATMCDSGRFGFHVWELGGAEVTV